MTKSILFVIVAILYLLCGCKNQINDVGMTNLADTGEDSSAISIDAIDDVNEVSTIDNISVLQIAAGVVPDTTNQDNLSFEMQDGVLFQGNYPVDTHILSLDLTNLDTNDWSFLLRFTDLEGLILNASNLTEADLKVIGSLPSLQTLIVFNYSHNNIDALSSCEKLQTLKILSAENLNDINMLAMLSRLTNLTILQAPNLTNGSAIAELENLKVLELEDVGLDNLSFLTGKSTVSTLSLRFMQKINDYSPIATVSNLESLTIFYCNFSQIEVLKELTSLSHIDVYCTDVASFAPLALYQLPLRSIGCDVSDEELKILMEAYPDCVFD